MLSFNLWLIERYISDFNSFLIETTEGRYEAPDLQIASTCDASKIEDWIREKYDQENLRSGPIRNPSMVIVNKLRHECLNYDQVRDSITAAWRKGTLSYCEKMETELALLPKVHEIVEKLIDRIDFVDPVPVLQSNGEPKRDADDEIVYYPNAKGFTVAENRVVEKSRMLISNQRYTDEAKLELQTQYDANNCYDKKLPAGVRRLGPAPTTSGSSLLDKIRAKQQPKEPEPAPTPEPTPTPTPAATFTPKNIGRVPNLGKRR